MKRLYRDEERGAIGGVCAGLAEYLEIDLTVVRCLFLITLFYGAGVLPYLILWIAIPKKPNANLL